MFTQKITPNPYGPKAEQGMCLQYVRQAFGLPLRYGSATEAWNNSPSKHRDRTYPKGVWFPVWWKLAGNVNGHVAFVAPDGRVYSTSNLAPNPLKVHPNIADVEAYYARYGHPLTYLGWTEDVAGYPVITASDISAEGSVTTQKEWYEMALDAQTKADIHAAVWGPPAAGEKGAPFITNLELNRPEYPRTTLGAMTDRIVRQQLKPLQEQVAAMQITNEKLVGALAAVAGGQPFDQAKLLASISTAVKAALPTTVTFK